MVLPCVRCGEHGPTKQNELPFGQLSFLLWKLPLRGNLFGRRSLSGRQGDKKKDILGRYYPGDHAAAGLRPANLPLGDPGASPTGAAVWPGLLRNPATAAACGAERSGPTKHKERLRRTFLLGMPPAGAFGRAVRRARVHKKEVVCSFYREILPGAKFVPACGREPAAL